MTTRRIFLRDPNWLPSLESLFGWHSQYDRFMRWHARLKSEPTLDMLLAFFLNCYALRDWLIQSEALSRAALDERINADPAMRLCRDLCNRSKHLVLNRASVDAQFAILREYRGKTRPPGIVVLAEGVKSDLNEVADRCVAFCQALLAEKLDVTPPWKEETRHRPG